jgi:excinuclease UvrABC ATPase subunit
MQIFANLAATTRRGIVVAALRSIVKNVELVEERQEEKRQGRLSQQDTYFYPTAADQSSKQRTVSFSSDHGCCVRCTGIPELFGRELRLSSALFLFAPASSALP